MASVTSDGASGTLTRVSYSATSTMDRFLSIRRDVIVDGDERKMTPLPLHHSDKDSMSLGRAPVDDHHSPLPILCERLDDTIDGEITHLRFVGIEQEIG